MITQIIKLKLTISIIIKITIQFQIYDGALNLRICEILRKALKILQVSKACHGEKEIKNEKKETEEEKKETEKETQKEAQKETQTDTEKDTQKRRIKRQKETEKYKEKTQREKE